MNNNNYIGNGTTIGKFILVPIATIFLTWLASKGLNLGVDAETLAGILGAIIGFIYAYLDAKYPNTFNRLGNQETENKVENEIEDVDPASDYDDI